MLFIYVIFTQLRVPAYLSLWVAVAYTVHTQTTIYFSRKQYMIPSLSDNIVQKLGNFMNSVCCTGKNPVFFSAAPFFIGSGFPYIYPHNDELGKRHHILYRVMYIYTLLYNKGPADTKSFIFVHKIERTCHLKFVHEHVASRYT